MNSSPPIPSFPGGVGVGVTHLRVYDSETPLEPGAFVWLTPGTIHRLINGDGALEILMRRMRRRGEFGGAAIATTAVENVMRSSWAPSPPGRI